MEIEEFPSIKHVLERIENEKPPNPFPTTIDDDTYEWIDYGDEDGGRIMPSLESSFLSPFLYRGQTKRFTPCLPALYRPLLKTIKQLSDVPKELQYQFLFYQLKCAEFEYSVNFHPSIKFSKKLGLHVNRKALAQHYGIPTDLLDLTQDHKVAAFFATSNLISDNTWTQVSDGKGVIYKFSFTNLFQSSDKNYKSDDSMFRKIEMIGLQTLPRPGEQKAWSFQMNPWLDFEKMPGKIYVFDQNTNESSEIFKYFDSGFRLFPNDIASSLAQDILHSHFIPKTIACDVFLAQGCDSNKLNNAITFYNEKFQSQFNVEIGDKEPIAFSSDQLLEAKRYLNKVKDRFLGKVGVRLVRDVKKKS